MVDKDIIVGKELIDFACNVSLNTAFSIAELEITKEISEKSLAKEWDNEVNEYWESLLN